MADTYEFDAAENQTIGNLATAIGFVGTTSVIAGALVMCLTVVMVANLSDLMPADQMAGNLIGNFVQGILSIAVGLWMRSGADHFKKVVDTQGEDISHLMNALEEMRKVFHLWKTLIIVVIVLVGIGIVLGGLALM